MKLYRFTHNNKTRLGVEVNGHVADLGASLKYYLRSEKKDLDSSGMLPEEFTQFVEEWDRNVQIAEKAIKYIQPIVAKQGSDIKINGEKFVYSFEEVNIESPLSYCSNFIGVGVNYQSHLDETKQPKPEYPILFFKTSSSIIGPGHPVILTENSKLVDYEVELAVIIGKRGKNVSKTAAYDYVAGYTVVNDITDRGVLLKSWGQLTYLDWFLAKAQDGFAPIGPCIVTKDEIPDPHDLSIKLRLNDRMMQDSSTGEMITRIPELIEYITAYVTLRPGDVIATGTPAGVGLFTGHILKDGDVIEATVEKIGTLRNPVKKI